MSGRIEGTLQRILGPEHVPAWLRPTLFDQDAGDPELGSVDAHRCRVVQEADAEIAAWEAFQADWEAREERLRAQRRNA